MKAKLIQKQDYGRVTIYELSEPIFKGKSDWSGEIDIPKSLNYLYDNLLPQYKEKANEYRKGDECYYVAISLARTHIEKLTFPAIKIGDNRFTFICDDIAGSHTFMSTGGDPSTIHDDEVYLQDLATLNGLNFEGIEK